MLNSSAFSDRILMLPLFQGMCREDFQHISARIRIGFQRLESGKVLAAAGTDVTALHFLLSGSLTASLRLPENGMVFEELCSRQMVIEPEALFGLPTRYERTYAAAEPSEILSVDKWAVRDLLFHYPTFRINYVNMLSVMRQRSMRHLTRVPSPRLDERFVRMLNSLSLYPAGYKCISTTRSTLARHLLATEAKLLEMLRHYADRGLLTQHRGRIEIPALEKLS